MKLNKVEMRHGFVKDDDGRIVGTRDDQATDRVPDDVLDAYIADARTRWQFVEVTGQVNAPNNTEVHTDHLKG